MLLKLIWIFFKIGLFTFGGGYAMIANIKETVVERLGWLTDEEFLQVVTIAESTPGPIAINMATYVGYKKRGVLGAIFSTLGVVIPSLVIIFLISLFLDEFMQNKYVSYAFRGIKCAVAFLILKAGVDMLKRLEKKPFPIVSFIAVFLLMLVLDVFSMTFSSIYLILIGGAVGIFVYSLKIFGEGKK